MKNKDITQEEWKSTRHGAWAIRGFNFQHLFSTLILVRQWAGLAPTGNLVPEGLEDCVVEFDDHEVWIQIKSRYQGNFTHAEVEKTFDHVGKKTQPDNSPSNRKIAVVIEQPRPDTEEENVSQLFNEQHQKVILCADPEIEIIGILTKHLETSEIIADGLVSDLFKLVSDTSTENASLSFEQRRRISTTEVEGRISERLLAEDPSAIDQALSSHLIEPVDFSTPVQEPTFYLGVKVKPGHIASGLVFERPNQIKAVKESLRSRRHVLLSGPSGAGKSALMWLSASATTRALRWFQITTKPTAGDAGAIVQFIKSRKPNERSPIGLVFDDVGSSNSDLWDLLVLELRGLPAVYLLGSIRQEDVNLIASQPDTEFFAVCLDEKLAQSVWENLFAKDQTTWGHWREPFEQSEGLMLEYIHILTQGKRLASVINEQVLQREKEERFVELEIIRATSVISSLDGEVNVSQLIESLGINPDNASQALKRLLKEHLLRESCPGILGGLHPLRSKALCEASHDDLIHTQTNSLWRSFLVTTDETLPRVIQFMFVNAPEEAKIEIIERLTEILRANDDPDKWIAVLTGLGLATLEAHAELYMATLENHDVQRAQWAFAAMFFDPAIDVPDLPAFESMKDLQNAVLTFRAEPKCDYRHDCIESLAKEERRLTCSNFRQANRVLSCLTPISGGKPVKMAFTPTFDNEDEYDIKEVSALLSTAYLVDPNMAENIVDALGGESRLFMWFRSQTAWVTKPIVEPSAKHGRTIRANFFYVADQYQSDPRQSVCDICETLMTLSPASNAAACEAIDPLGNPITFNGLNHWSKNIPRENPPGKTRVAWNVAFRQVMLAKVSSTGLTEYTEQMALLIKRTEKVFRSYSEKWIKGKAPLNADALVEEINAIIQEVNDLAYCAPQNPAHVMTASPETQASYDSLGALLTGVLGNLLRRMANVSKEGGERSLATFAGSLVDQAIENQNSDIWRTISSPPLNNLLAMSERLKNISYILHEMAQGNGNVTIQKMIKAARKSTPSRAVFTVGRRCQTQANQRFQRRLQKIEKSLKNKGWNAKCWSKPILENDTHYWPAQEVAIVIQIKDFDTDISYIEDGLLIGEQYLETDRRFRVVPMIYGHVLPALAIAPSSPTPLLDLDFSQEWQEHIAHPFFNSQTAVKFEEAVGACIHISGIVTCRDLNQLHPLEDEVFSNAKNTFETNRQIISIIAENSDHDIFNYILNYLDECWDKVVDEFDAAKAGTKAADPFCMIHHTALSGQDNEEAVELGTAKILLLQAECQEHALLDGAG